MANFFSQFGGVLGGVAQGIPGVGGFASNVITGITETKQNAEAQRRAFELAKIQAMQPRVVESSPMVPVAAPSSGMIERDAGMAPGISTPLVLVGIGLVALLVFMRRR